MIRDYDHLAVGLYETLTALTSADKDAENDLAIVAALSGKTEDELLTMPLTEYAALRDAAAFLFTTPPVRKVRKAYDCGGFRLVPLKDFHRLTTAQFIDFQEYANAGEDLLVRTLSVVLVPEGHTYGDGYDILDVQAAIREHLSIIDAVALRDFFMRRLGSYLRSSLTCSAAIARKTMKGEQREETLRRIAVLWASTSDGCGAGLSTRSPRLRAVLGPRYMR